MEISSLWKNLPISIMRPVRQRTGFRLRSSRVADRGFQISGLRQFVIGDSFRAISRKHYARTGEEIIVERNPEQNALILFLLDMSGSMLVGSKRRKIEAGLDLLRHLGSACLWQGNKLQLLAFSDRIELESDVIASFGTFEYVLEELAELAPESRQTDHGEAVDRAIVISEMTNAPADLVCIVSDFLLPYSLDIFFRDINQLQERSDVIGLLIRDPAEEDFPKTGGCLQARDAETGEYCWLSGIHSPDMLQELAKQDLDVCLLRTDENDQQWYAILDDFFSLRQEVSWK